MEDKSSIDDIINSMNNSLKNLNIDNNLEALDNIEDKLDNDIEIVATQDNLEMETVEDKCMVDIKGNDI